MTERHVYCTTGFEDIQLVTAAGATGNTSLRRADEVIAALSVAPKAERKALLLTLANTLLPDAQPSEADPLQPLFDVHLPPSTRSVIAVVCWRALQTIDFDKSEQHRVVDLLDDVYGKGASLTYHNLGLEVRDQTYKKVATLRDALTKFFHDLDAIIAGIASIEQIGRARHGFMRHLNSPVGQIVVQPFLTRTLVDRDTFDRLFGSVSAYAETSPAEIVAKREAAVAQLQGYIANCDACGTSYATAFARFAARILDVLQAHFASSPAAKPATLQATPVKKKYPFHRAGAPVIIGVKITNEGPGHAFDVRLAFETDVVTADRGEQYVGNLPPGSRVVDVSCTVRQPANTALIYAHVSWHDFDGTQHHNETILEFASQRADIDWDDLAKRAPYHLQPVEHERELAGRHDVLNQLIAQVGGPSVGSSYIYGQRRVGKTSIVKTFKHRINTERPGLVSVVYLEAGDFVDPSGIATVKRLGEKLCDELRATDRRFETLAAPHFQDALAPISDFLGAALRLVSDLRVLFVLDEFDELPVELYRRGMSASPLFLTIRSVSGNPHFGFVLVGGEKMNSIIAAQGQQLNKFQPIRVDYFDRQQNWSSFSELVRRPVADWIEITDEALETLWEHTAGNPFFTRLICGELFRQIVRRRDSHVTNRDVRDAISATITSTAANSFQHFWDDGINAESAAEAEDTSVARRKVLLALGHICREGTPTTAAAIVSAAESFGMSAEATQHELRDFLRRDILVADGNLFHCRVGLFQRWLQERGQLEIMTTITNRQASLAQRSADERAYVTSAEISDVLRKWGHYQGRLISEDDVRMWLQQFGKNPAQRRAFRVLEQLTFYSDQVLRQRMRAAHLNVIRGLTWTIEEGRRKRSDILISYVDGGTKNGLHHAKLYADENGILAANVVERTKIRSVLNDGRFQALVFVDDFLGTGDSAREHFGALASDLRVVLATRPIRLFYVAVAGFPAAKTALEQALAALELPVIVYLCDLLGPEARCFGETSLVYPSVAEREEAHNLIMPISERLLPDAPLGYGDCQVTVVFDSNCPKNTLPILWAETRSWTPLFKRR